ncbi:MAG TPA: glycosyltransferase family 2 protein [Longimicrobiales bacterium]
MRLSVIVTTYNQPEWLDLVLCGYAAQEFRDFELIIADDGSDRRTGDVIERARRGSDVPILHIWHEDHGFRKCEILNRAILAASGDILLFTDGDCIPRRDLLTVHDCLLRPGRFLSGGYAKLSERVSRAITRSDVVAGRATDYRWLRRQGAEPSRALLRLLVPQSAAAVLDLITPTRPSFNGHNASVWRQDIVRVNGFDERMGWGGLDRELGERLENAGIRGFQVRHRAHVVHLFHVRGYRRPEVIRANRSIRDETASTRRVRTPFGLDRHISVDTAIS